MKIPNQLNVVVEYCYRCGFRKHKISLLIDELECRACCSHLNVSNGHIVLPIEIAVANKSNMLLQSAKAKNIKEIKKHAEDLKSMQPENIIADICIYLAANESDVEYGLNATFPVLPHNMSSADAEVIFELIFDFGYFKYHLKDHISRLIEISEPSLQSDWLPKFEKTIGNWRETSTPLIPDNVEIVAGNIMNGGFVAHDKENGFEYYSNGSDGFKLYRMKKGCTPQKISDDMCRSISIATGYVYYINTKNHLLYRVSANGGYPEQLSDDRLECAVLADQWIYFSNADEDGVLYKINVMNGKLMEFKYSGRFCQYINVVGGYVYYRSVEHSGKLYRINVDTKTAPLELCNDNCLYVHVIGDAIYYINASEGYKIYRIGIDGSGRSKPLVYDICRTMNIADGWIYYTCLNLNGVFRKRISGRGQATPLVNTQIKCSNINISGEWVYFCNRTDGNNLYRIKVTGKDLHLIGSYGCDAV